MQPSNNSSICNSDNSIRAWHLSKALTRRSREDVQLGCLCFTFPFPLRFCRIFSFAHWSIARSFLLVATNAFSFPSISHASGRAAKRERTMGNRNELFLPVDRIVEILQMQRGRGRSDRHLVTSAWDKLHLFIAAVPGCSATAQGEILEISHHPVVLECTFTVLKQTFRRAK